MSVKKTLHLITVTGFFFLSISPVPGFAFNVSVVQGNATVSTSGNTVTINVTSKAILQGNISIPAGITVKVVQGLNDILLRDTTGSATNILGSLLSNGNIILINSMGVFIGQSAIINVGGLIASTLNISNQDFLNGNYQFTKIAGLNPAQILNEANISVANGGYVILLSDRVVNKGTITAYMGTVALGSGQQATVSFDQGGLVNLVIDKGLAQQLTGSNGNPQAQIVNNGSIYANGGKIQMSAQLLETTLKHIIDNTGIVEADNVVEHGGLVELTSNGAIDNSGIIQTGTLSEQGETFDSKGVLDIGHGYFSNLDGAINISGNISGIYSDVNDIDLTGAVTLIGDTTLQADSGDTGTQGEIVMNGYSLTGGGFNLTLTAGLNDTLDGSITGVNLLTLNSSTSNNRTFTSTGATFSVNTLKTNYYSLFSRSQGGGTLGDPYMIYSDSDVVGGLQYIPTESLSAYYELANNIDATETSSWNSGAGFVPIGDSSTPFTGTFNGNGYTISNLFIDLPSTNSVGLFGSTSGSTIENVGVTNVNITGANYVGGLVGSSGGSSSVDNSYASGSVSGSVEVGGLVGANDTSSSITNSYSSASASGIYAGGLAGINYTGSIDDSYATGSISGSDSTGGLVGYNQGGSINSSYATGTVTSGGVAGGLVGENVLSSTISNSYATGNVSGNNRIGGLAGFNYASTIDNSYATGNVSGSSDKIGGLTGANLNSSTITNSYATGGVSGTTNLGGIIGYDDGSNTITNNWWYDSLSKGIGNNGSNTSTGHWEKAGAASDFFSSSQAVYNGTGPWDISSSTGHTWGMSGDDDSYPLLQFRYFTTISDDYQLQLMFLNYGASYSLANNIDASDTSNWNAGNGFAPIGISSPFTGTFNGDGYTISNLFIDLPSTNNVGLFGYTSGATIENIGVVSANIRASNFIGGLVAYNLSSTIDNSYVSGSVGGSSVVGGLIGWDDSSTISGSYATANILGSSDVGGLVGYNTNSSKIANSYSTGSVTGSSENAGGLVGYNDSSAITNSYATGNVVSGNYVGGLVGWNNNSSNIDNSYATGSVDGTSLVGGLVGYNSSSGIANSYSTGSVTATASDLGGLVGYSDSSSSIDNSYTTGNVTTSVINTGGLMGASNSSTLTNNWWYNSLSYGVGNSGSPTSTGHWQKAGAASDFYSSSQSVYSSWDFNGLWSTTGSSYPTLVWQSMNNGSFIGGTTSIPFLVYNVNELQFMGYDLSASFQLASNINASATSGWNSGTGFIPVGNSSTSFTGTFNGDGYTISNLFIDLPSTNDVGLFGYTSGVNIENVGLVGNNTTGGDNVGALVGYNNSSSVANSYATGGVVSDGGGGIGGPRSDAGGLVGYNNSSSIDNSYATGSVSGSNNFVGGLVGYNNNASIDDSYATGSVSGSVNYVGGLVGENYNSSSIANSYATGSVSSNVNVGGLAGESYYYSSITNSYATGNVTGSINVGGLVGGNYNVSGITNSFATGSVSGSTSAGGLIGYDDASNTLTNNWWYNSLSNGIGNYGPNTSTGQWEKAGAASDFYSSSQAVYTGSSPWDFSSIWFPPSGTYPQLR